MSHPRTVCIDLDGTIATYDEWRGPDHFGEPIPGARAALTALKAAGWRIIIFTTRGDRARVRTYLTGHQIPFDFINENPDQPPNTNPGKPVADIYIDDRALSFRGDWTETLTAVASFKLWYRPEGDADDPSPY